MLNFRLLATNATYLFVTYTYSNNRAISAVDIERPYYNSPVLAGQMTAESYIELNEYKKYDTIWFKELVEPNEYYKGLNIKDTGFVSVNKTEVDKMRI